MTAEQNRRWRPLLDAERSRALEEPIHRRAVELARPAAFAVGLRDARQELEIDLLREPAECAVTDFITHLVPGSRLEMLRGDPQHLSADVVSVDGVDVQSIEQRGRRRHPELLVIHRSDPTI